MEYKTQEQEEQEQADKRAARIRGLRAVAQHLHVSEVNSRSVVESERLKATRSVILDVLRDYEHEHERIII